MSKPLFIIGKHRSGTTFLANLLLAHPAVAAVFSDQECGGITGGVFESSFFTTLDGRYGDLSVFENYMEFISTASCLEYFRLADCSLDEFLTYYPTDYASFFQRVMEKAALRKGAEYWMEKTPTHTLRAETLKSYYPQAKFIGIKRDEVDMALSALYLANRQDASRWGRLLCLVKVTCLKGLYDKMMQVLEKRWPGDVLVLTYEALTGETDACVSKICRFLEIPSQTLQSAYKKNTSYRKAEKKELFRYEQSLVRFCYRMILSVVPLWFLKMSYSRYLKCVPEPMPRWMFRTYRMGLSKEQKQQLPAKT